MALPIPAQVDATFNLDIRASTTETVVIYHRRKLGMFCDSEVRAQSLDICILPMLSTLMVPTRLL